LERLLRKRSWHLPLACDLLALGFFMYIGSSTSRFGFRTCSFAMRPAFAGTGTDVAAVRSTLFGSGFVTAVKGDIQWMRVVSWLGLTAGTFAGGAGLAFLGDRNRRFSSQIEFFSRISATMQVDQGLAESLRLFLEELATTFDAEEALLLTAIQTSSAFFFGA